MISKLFEPRRLRDSTEPSGSVEGRLARHLRVLSDYAPMPQLRRYSMIPRRQRHIIMTFRIAALVILLAMVSGAAAATARYVVRRVWPLTTTLDHTSESLAKPVARRPRSVARIEPAISPAPVPTVPAVAAPASASSASEAAAQRRAPVRSAPTNLGRKVPELSGEAPARPASVPALEPLPLPASDAPTPPAVAYHGSSQARADGVSQEAVLLRQALTALRRERDAQRALALLDDYDARFKEGALAWEATSARAQALLGLGDKTRALALLDRLPLRQDGHTGELWVIRGELRSLAGRCAEALRDFDAIMQASLSNRDQTARALFGRASCRARLGDAMGAEQDRQRYLREFPQGPAAKQMTTP